MLSAARPTQVQPCEVKVTRLSQRWTRKLGLETPGTPGKAASVFLSTLIYRYKLLLPQVVWLSPGGVGGGVRCCSV